jgi:hypothetical protein
LKQDAYGIIIVKDEQLFILAARSTNHREKIELEVKHLDSGICAIIDVEVVRLVNADPVGHLKLTGPRAAGSDGTNKPACGVINNHAVAKVIGKEYSPVCDQGLSAYEERDCRRACESDRLAKREKSSYLPEGLPTIAPHLCPDLYHGQGSGTHGGGTQGRRRADQHPGQQQSRQTSPPKRGWNTPPRQNLKCE